MDARTDKAPPSELRAESAGGPAPSRRKRRGLETLRGSRRPPKIEICAPARRKKQQALRRAARQPQARGRRPSSETLSPFPNPQTSDRPAASLAKQLHDRVGLRKARQVARAGCRAFAPAVAVPLVPAGQRGAAIRRSSTTRSNRFAGAQDNRERQTRPDRENSAAAARAREPPPGHRRAASR